MIDRSDVTHRLIGHTIDHSGIAVIIRWQQPTLRNAQLSIHTNEFRVQQVIACKPLL